MDLLSRHQRRPEKWSRISVGNQNIPENESARNWQRLVPDPIGFFFQDAPSVVKAQILAGGRGKGKYESDGKGGVRIMSSYVTDRVKITIESR